MRITKEENEKWLKYFMDETVALSNELNQYAKELPNHRWDTEGYKKLVERMKQTIYKRDAAYHKWYTHYKISEGFDV